MKRLISLLILSAALSSGAVLVTCASGIFTAAATWCATSAVSAAYLDSEAGSTASTTSYVYSATFTPAAANVDAVAVKILSATAGAGTFTLILANNTTPGTREGSLAINANDFTTGSGWYLFKFAAAVSPNGTDVYKIGIRSSTASTVTVYRDGTAGNWSRLLRLTSTAAPGSGDQLHVMGEWTAAATLTARTVTMDNTATTSFGPTISGTGPPQGVTISKGGVWTNGVTASTAYYFRWKGVFRVYNAGTLNIGESAAVVPVTSSAIYEMDSFANVDTGFFFDNGSIVNVYGGTKNNTQTKLGASFGGFGRTTTTKSITSLQGQNFTQAGYVDGDTIGFISVASLGTTVTSGAITITGSGTIATWTAAPVLDTATAYSWIPKAVGAARTQITLANVDLSTWVDGDQVVVAATGRMNQETEVRTIAASGVNNTTKVVTFTAALVYVHADMAEAADAAVMCEVINLTRNIRIRGIGTNVPSTTATLQGYVYVAPTAVVNVQYAEFYYLGSATTGKRGIDVATTTGTFKTYFSSIHDGWIASTRGWNFTGTSGQALATVILSDSVSYQIATDHVSNVTTTGVMKLNKLIGMVSQNVTDNRIFLLYDAGGETTNLTGVGGGPNSASFEINDYETIGTISNLTAHGSIGGISCIKISNLKNASITGITAWRSGTVFGQGLSLGGVNNVTINTVFLMGNSVGGIGGASFTPLPQSLVINSATIGGDLVFPSPVGITSGASYGNTSELRINNSTIGGAAGFITAHTSSDIELSQSVSPYRLVLTNTTLGSNVPVASWAALADNHGSFVSAHKHGGTAGDHRAWLKNGIGRTDSVIFFAASQSYRMTPTSASVRMESAPPGWGWRLSADGAGTVSVSVRVRRSLSTDANGANHNGEVPRLMVRISSAAGITADTVLASGTAAYAPGGANTGEWELLTGTTPTVTDDGGLEFFVDVTGTAGWINVDSAITTAKKRWLDGFPRFGFIEPTATRSWSIQ